MSDYWGKHPLETQAGFQDYLRVQPELGRRVQLISSLEPGPSYMVHESVIKYSLPYLHHFLIEKQGLGMGGSSTYILLEATKTIKHFVEWLETGDYKMMENSFHDVNPLILHARIYTLGSRYNCNELQTNVTVHVHHLLLEKADTIQPHHDIEFLEYLAEYHGEGRDHLREVMVKKVGFKINAYVNIPQFKRFGIKYPRIIFEIMHHVEPGRVNPIAPLVIDHEAIFARGDSPLRRAIHAYLADKGLRPLEEN